MKILTVGFSPYFLTSLGQINSDILRCLKKEGYEIFSAVWNLNLSWHFPKDDGTFVYEKDEEEVCRIFPISRNQQKCTTQLYDIVKSVKPDVVLSICDYQDLSSIYAIKNLDNDLFKWILYCIADNLPVNEKFYEAFELADLLLTSTKRASEEIANFSKKDCFYLPYGPENSNFLPQKTKNSIDKIVCSSKNIQSSNLSAIIRASSLVENTEFYLHTNHSDAGENDLAILLQRYGKNIKLPDKFVSLDDGIPKEELFEIYYKSDIILDVSVGSATGISILEAMSCGCIPVVAKTVALSEILEEIPEEYRFFVDGVSYIGDNEEEFFVVSHKDLAKKIKNILDIKEKKPKEFEKIRSICMNRAKKFSKNEFDKKIVKFLKELENKGRILKVEEFL